MGREWQIGDPVDYSTDGWMDAQNWSSGYYVEDDEPASESFKRDDYLDKARDYYMNYNNDDALYYVNLALDLDNYYAISWNLKGIILEGMKRYEEADKCYRRSLQLHQDNLVRDNRARMLYDWAYQLVEESKNALNPRTKLFEAQEKITTAINTLPGQNSEEDINKYLNFKDSIFSLMDMEKEYQDNLDILKKYKKRELFTIAGNNFCNNHRCFAPGTAYTLVKEPNNEFDCDAIAVYFRDEKIGYVANSSYTVHEKTSSASDLKDKIADNAKAKYLFTLNRYEKNFLIGRIIETE